MQFKNLLIALPALVAAAPAPAPTPAAILPRYHSFDPTVEFYNYSSVPGVFLQDNASTVASTFDYSQYNFGLINRTYPTDTLTAAGSTQWQKFAAYVTSLNANAAKGVSYKVLFMGRHGEGYHNVAETYYGTPAWNCYWSLLDGNGTVTWSDAKITPNGIAQAVKANAYWASRIALQKIPTPDSYYSSPLTRCLQTSNITFFGLDLPAAKPFVPTVKEYFRESISGHTCDRRGTRTYIEKSYPDYEVEKGFAKTDELWVEGLTESTVDQDIRSKTALDDVFDNDDGVYLSITSHSGEIGSLLRVLGHQAFSLSTGQIIPVLVKAVLTNVPSPVVAPVAWATISTCAVQPTRTVVARSAMY